MRGQAHERVPGEGGEAQMLEEGAGWGVVFADVGMDAGDAELLQAGQKGLHQRRAGMAGAEGGGEVDVKMGRMACGFRGIGFGGADPEGEVQGEESAGGGMPEGSAAYRFCGQPGKNPEGHVPPEGAGVEAAVEVAGEVAVAFGDPTGGRFEIGVVAGEEIGEYFAVGEERVDGVSGVGGVAAEGAEERAVAEFIAPDPDGGRRGGRVRRHRL